MNNLPSSDLRGRLAALLEATKVVASSLNLEQSLQAIVQQASIISGTNIVRLYLLDEQAKALRCQVAVGLPVEESRDIVIPVGESFLSGQVAASGKPLAVADTRNDPRLLNPQYAAKHGLVSYLGLPVKVGDRVLGVLVFNTEAPRPYSNEEIGYLSAFADQAAIAIENARLYEVARLELAERKRAEGLIVRQGRLLAAINRVFRQVVTAAKEEEVAHTCLDAAQELTGSKFGFIGEITPEGRFSTIALSDPGWAACRIPRTNATVLINDMVIRGIWGQVILDQRSVMVNDPTTCPFRVGTPERHPPIQSFLGVPLRHQDRVIGMIAVANNPAGYTAVEQEDLETLSFAFVEALHRKRAEEALARRTQQLEAVRAVSTEITREMDLTTLLQLITQRSIELVGAAAGSIYLWDEAGGVLIPQAWHGLGEWMGEVRLKPGEAVAGTVAQRREGMIVNDFPASPYAFPLFQERAGPTAVLAEPLLYRDRLVGVIALNHKQAGRQFTEEHQSLLRLFADQAAIAIENARLHEATVQWMRQLTTLNGVARALAAELDPQRVAQQILQAVETLLPGAAARLWEFVEDKKAVRLVASIGLREAEGDLHVPIGRDNLSGMAFATQQPVISRDLQQDPRYLSRAWAASEGLVSCIVMPLVRAGCYLGDLKVFTRIPHDFTQAEIDALRLFADQAAIAIENARLHERLTTRLKRQQALTRLSQLISSSLNVDAVLSEIAQAAAELMGGTQVTFWTVDEASRTLEPRAFSNAGIADYPRKSLRFGEGGVGWVAEHRQPLNVPDRYADERFFAQTWAKEHGFVSFLGVPVVLGSSLLAVLVLNGRQPFRLDPDDQSLLDSFVAQAAIAIENARLYDEVLRHAAELESRVRARTAELEEALRVKMEFLGKMSHELRTPLNFILGFSDLLGQGVAGPLSPKQAAYVDRIHGGGRRLLSLVTDVLDIAQMDVGKSRLQLEPLILGPLVQEVLGLVQAQASKKRLGITTSLDSWLPFIVADRFKLGQILFRLVSNAVKFTPAGGSITIRTYQEAEGRKQAAEGREHEADGAALLPSAECRPPSVVIEVEDTGIGIRPEDLETIFAAFHQVDGSDTRAYEGAGLGLTLVRRFVEQHGGRVWAESPGLGQGARFIVRLPRLEIPRAMTVLFVEDDEMMRASSTSVLESAGFKVVQAADGSQALAALAGEPPDLLILDLVLPDMDGWEILRRVRGVEKIPRFPVLVITGLEGASAEEALRLGADEFLAKPVSPRVFVDTVLRLLAQPVVARGAEARSQ